MKSKNTFEKNLICYSINHFSLFLRSSIFEIVYYSKLIHFKFCGLLEKIIDIYSLRMLIGIGFSCYILFTKMYE